MLKALFTLLLAAGGRGTRNELIKGRVLALIRKVLGMSDLHAISTSILN